MAHCPYEQLADIQAMLAEIRKWPEIREVKPGIFYLKRKPFLHFHLKDGERWADARCGKDWGPCIRISINASAEERRRFLSAVTRCYKASLAAFAPGR